jgi:hypothetical protein
MEKIIRIRIKTELLKKFKILCVENDISIPKQTEIIIKNFIKQNERL